MTGPGYVKIQLGGMRFYFTHGNVKVKVTPIKVGYGAFRRRMLRERDHCEICGIQLDRATLSLHHIKPQALYPELVLDPGNVQCLCSNCHKRLHIEEDRRKAEIAL